jgi:hypothetical protein
MLGLREEASSVSRPLRRSAVAWRVRHGNAIAAKGEGDLRVGCSLIVLAFRERPDSPDALHHGFLRGSVPRIAATYWHWAGTKTEHGEMPLIHLTPVS